MGNYIKTQNMLRVAIYRDIQRVICSYKQFAQYSLPSMKDFNAVPRKNACKYIMHVTFAMLPSERNPTSINF